ncbi:TlpA family protein disulfide reductase [Dyadobacter psychrotolerans]|uniref:TlpA family protein disulfide reductase n=1 Tax=Dyadobacter psychrotolerans TaxID=2541721 RepID=A0A4R5DX01_9BACT|nr:TlpA disulfide reductase family protein [Dyadobacter psychrotolerans]TDE16691.1 TlpA family protein disulfide reductase [Dyadobacter psychrotolerans]
MASVSKKILVPALIIVAALAVYFAFFKSPEVPPALTESSSDVASEANDGVYLTSLSTLDGQNVPMDQEKLVFLNVWATWCGPCNMEMPGIQKLYDKYKSNDKVAFYIVSDEDPATVNPFIERKGYKLPFYQYAGAYPAALDGNAIPRTYIIYKGKILAQEIGASQWDRPEIAELIEKNLAEI